MKALTIALTILGLSLAGCNAVGPYSAEVYSLDGTLFMVSVSTWLGSDGGWPRGSESLKKSAESLVKDQLIARGVPIQLCEFIRFVPYQGGHMSMTLVAGESRAVRKWAGMSESEFDSELRKRAPLQQILQFEGRIDTLPGGNEPSSTRRATAEPSERRQVLR